MNRFLSPEINSEAPISVLPEPIKDVLTINNYILNNSQVEVAFKVYEDTDITLIEQDNNRVVLKKLFSFDCKYCNKILSICLLSNFKFYIIYNKDQTILTYKDEVDLKSTFDILLYKNDILEQTVKELKQKIINIEIGFSILTGFTPIGYIDYAVKSLNELNGSYSDLSIAYCDESKEFYYFSEFSKTWLVLPKYWQKLKSIVRRLDDNIEYSEVGEILSNSTFKNINGRLEFFIIDADKEGDLYVVNNGGFVVLTRKGWTIIAK